MKIIQIGSYMMGAQKTIEEGIHRHIVARGHESRILYIRGRSNAVGAICCENRLENLLTRICRRFLGKRPQFARFQTVRIVKKISRFRPDIVHLHVLHGGCIDYEYLFRYLVRQRIPVVYTMHDMWAHTGGCYHNIIEGCTGYQSGCIACGKCGQELDVAQSSIAHAFTVKKSLLLNMEKLHCVTVSHWVADELRKGFLSLRPIHVIYNGVEQERKDCKEVHSISRKGKKIRIICAAVYWDQGKGIDIIFELARLLGVQYEILIIGHISDEQKEQAPANVQFYGYCPDREKLFSLFQASDLHVTASQVETFGMTLVEAAMAGIRSIGFERTAIGEVLALVNGIVVAEPTVEALHNAITEAVKENKLHLSSEEIDLVYSRFSIKRMAEEYITLYEKIIE